MKLLLSMPMVKCRNPPTRTFRAGTGTSRGSSTSYDHALSSVESVIAASQQMYYMAMADRFSTMSDVEKFLDTAAIGYGAS
jgi:hypothetical protein